MANPVYVTCSHGGRSRKDRTVSKDWKNVRCWETSFGSNAMVFGVHMYQAWTLPNHQTTHFLPLYDYINIYIYIYIYNIYMEDDKQVINKLYSFCKKMPIARKTILSSFLLHWLRGPSFPVSLWRISIYVGWDLHGISMWKGAIKEAVEVSRI